MPLQLGHYEAEYVFDAVGLDDRPIASQIFLDIAQNTKSIASRTIVGEEGTKILRAGSAIVRFSNSQPGAFFEFRIFTEGRPFDGKFRFSGVFLNRVWSND